jgi:protein ImuA
MVSLSLPASGGVRAQAPFCLDDGGLDAAALVFRGPDHAALHEICPAAPSDAAAATAFALALVTQLAGAGSAVRPVVWVRSQMCDIEAGALHAVGIAALGCDPALIRLVRVRDAMGGLQAVLEAARLPGLGAAVLELWGDAAAYDLTASRRLVLASARSRTPVLILRAGGAAHYSATAALSRWRLSALPSRPLPAGAPGFPAVSLTLLRSRAGRDGQQLHLEWVPHARRFLVSSPATPAANGSAAGQHGGSTLSPLSGGRPAFPAGGAADPPERARRSG